MANFSTDTEIFQHLVRLLNEGRACALITILRASGSVPREAGTNAIVDASGALYGTIGGGLLEAKAKTLALECLQTQRAEVFDFQFSGNSAQGNAPICGGQLRVLVDPHTKVHAEVYKRVVADLEAHQRGVLLTVLSKRTRQTEVRWITQTASENDMVQAAFKAATAVYFSVPDEDNEGIAQLLAPTQLLLIAGGGHVGQALAWQAPLVGFRVAVFDDRAEFCESALYPENTILRSGELEEFFDEFPLTQDTFIALVGRNHQVDMQALKLCLCAPVAYLGMMGSQRKVELMRRELNDELFYRLHAPIGINIGAQTVPEIAASIVAELIAVRRGAKI